MARHVHEVIWLVFTKYVCTVHTTCTAVSVHVWMHVCMCAQWGWWLCIAHTHCYMVCAYLSGALPSSVCVCQYMCMCYVLACSTSFWCALCWVHSLCTSLCLLLQTMSQRWRRKKPKQGSLLVSVINTLVLSVSIVLADVCVMVSASHWCYTATVIPLCHV